MTAVITRPAPAPAQRQITTSHSDSVARPRAESVGTDAPDTQAPVWASANITGNKLLMTYTDDGLLDATNLPSVTAFTVKVDKATVTATDVFVDAKAKTVTLLLEKPVLYGQSVVLTYRDPGRRNDANAIQDQSGNDAASLKAVAVTNDTLDTTPPAFVSAAVNGTSLVLAYSDEGTLDAEHAPSADDFTVQVNGGLVEVNRVAVNAGAKTMTLKLAEPVLYQQAVTVSYRDPGKANDENAIQDKAGNDAASLSEVAVSNETPDKAAPVFVSAEVNGSRLGMVYNDNSRLDAGNPPAASAFSVRAGGEEITVTDVAVDAKSNTLNLTLAASVTYGQTVTVAYQDTGSDDDANAIQDIAGNDAASLKAKPVTNNTADTEAPVWAGANVTGAKLVITYTDEAMLDAINLPPATAFSVKSDKEPIAVTAVAMDAKAKTVTLLLEKPVLDGEGVVLTYQDPGKANDANAIQDQSGNDAASLKAVAVTNDTLDTTPPAFVSAAVNGTSLVLAYSDEGTLDGVNLPSFSAFSVNADDKTIEVTKVAVSARAKTVTLTLAAPVVHQQSVTLTYKDASGGDDTNTIQDQRGNDAASFSAIAVTNNTPDKTPPGFVSAMVNGASLVLAYSDKSGLDAVNLPSPTAFTVKANNVAIAVMGMAVDETTKTVTLNLATPVTYQQAVTVAYKDPSRSNDEAAVQDAAGNDAVSLAATTVANITPDITPPAFMGAVVDETQLVLNYADVQPLDGSGLPLIDAFRVKVDGVSTGITAIGVDAELQTVSLTLAAPVSPTQAVTVAYRDPGKGDDAFAIQDKSGNDAVTLPDSLVLNKTKPYTLYVDAPVYTEEGGFDTTTLLFTVRIDRPSSTPISIDYAAPNTGTELPDDFQLAAGVITLKPGEIQASLPISVKRPDDLESPLIDKTLDVEFSGSRLAAPVTITNILFDAGETAVIDNRIRFTTSAQDNIRGTTNDRGIANADVFVAEVTNSSQANATNTLSAGDYADGGGQPKGQQDRLILTATDSRSDADTSVIGFELKNIEELEIRAYDADSNDSSAGEVVLGLVNAKGLKTILSTTSDANITLNTVQNLVNLDITGNGYSGSALTVNYINDVIKGAATTQKITLHGFGEPGGGTQGVIAIDGVETFQMDVRDKNSIVQLAGNQLKKLNMTLRNDITLIDSRSIVDTLTKVDVNVKKADSKLTGALIADFSASGKDMIINTGAGSDDIKTGSGNDRIDAKAGNNAITSGFGNDTITSGNGNDKINAGEGFNVINAGNGNNKITTGGDNDNIITGGGNDTVDAGGSRFIDDGDNTNDYDTVATGDGADVITLGKGAHSIMAGNGNDTVELGENLDSDDTIDGGTGTNTLKVPDVDSINDSGDFSNVSSFGTLFFTKATGGTINADTVGDDATNLNDVGVSTYTFSQGITADTEINNVTTTDGSMTVNLLSGTKDASSLAINGQSPLLLGLNITNSAKADETLNSLTVGNVTDLTLDFQDGDLKDGVDSLMIGGMLADELTELTLSGNANISIDGSISSTQLTSVTSTVVSANIRLDTSNTGSDTTITTLGGADTLISGSGADSIDSGEGADSIDAGNGNNRVDAGEGRNSIATGSGADTITAGSGNDTIKAGNGKNRVEAGDGNNSIATGNDADTIIAGVGNDTITAGDGNDVVQAGAGNDTITAGAGVETLEGGAGNDVFEFNYDTDVDKQGLTSADVVSGGEGSDTVKILAASAANVTLVDDIYNQWSSVETLDISSAIDTGSDTDSQAGSATLNAIAFRAALETVITGAGNDYVAIGEGFKAGLTIELRGGTDTVDAGSAPADSIVTVFVSDSTNTNLTEADNLTGGKGKNDTLKIQANDGTAVTNATNFEAIQIVDGKDKDRDGNGDATLNLTVTDQVVKSGQIFTVNATALVDRDAAFTFNGAGETDGLFSLISGAGSDDLQTGTGADTITGGDGNNTIKGNDGADSITSGQGNDILDGGEGNDTLESGAGQDTLDGGTGQDTLTAGSGNDSLSGGDGADELKGEAGNDTLFGGLGKDTLSGGEGADQFLYSLADLGVDNVDTILDFGSSDIIVLSGLAGASRSQPITRIEFKGNFDSFGASQGAVNEGVAGASADDGIIEAVYQADSNTVWVDLNEDGALNADDLQILLTGTTALAQNNFMAI